MYYKGINSYVKSFRIMVLADKNRKISTGNQAIKLKLACLIYKDILERKRIKQSNKNNQFASFVERK